MAIVNGEVLRLGVLWVYQNIAYQMNVLHVQVSDIAAQTQQQILDDIEQYLENIYTANIVTYMTDQLVHVRTDIFSTQNNAPETGLGANVNMNGASGAEALPLQIAAETYFRTGVSRHIGRVFWPTFQEGSNASGVVLTATRNALQTAGNYMIAAHTMPNGTTITYGILDRSSAIFRQPTQAVVPIHFRTQRRRRIGVGI